MLFVAFLLTAILFYALHRKGDVKARLKIPFVAFFLEAKDRKHDTVQRSDQKNEPISKDVVSH